MTAPVLCDSCGARTAKAEFPLTTPFGWHPLGDRTRTYVVTSWAACTSCAPLILFGSWRRLADRHVNATLLLNPQLAGLATRLRADALALHERLEDAGIGPHTEITP